MQQFLYIKHITTAAAAVAAGAAAESIAAAADAAGGAARDRAAAAAAAAAAGVKVTLCGFKRVYRETADIHQRAFAVSFSCVCCCLSLCNNIIGY